MNNDANAQVLEILEAYRAHCDNEKGCDACEYRHFTDCGVAFTMDWMRYRATTKSRKDLAPAANATEDSGTVEAPSAPCNCLAALAERVTEAREEVAAIFDKKTTEGTSDFDAMCANICTANRARGAMTAFDHVIAMIQDVENEREHE